MEVQILRYYSKVFSLLFLFIILSYCLYIIFLKEINLKNNIFEIQKNQSYKKIIESNIKDHKINLVIYTNILKLITVNNTIIHHGKFRNIQSNNFYNLINIITSVSNYFEKLTIIEGSSKNDLNILLKKNFKKFNEFDYNEIIADTYYFNYGSKFIDFKKKLTKNFLITKNKYKDHKLLKRFTFDQILIIGSLLEKEGLDADDKKKIFSVIINRLNKNMRLQIDATVIYAITEGKKKLNRKLTYNDLKINHEFNTYFIKGLPPKPISYVGIKTIDIIFENYTSEYLFYFFDIKKKKHIYSINYKNHLKKLNEYRSKQ